MALRLPGKGNFKPSKPVKPGAGGPRRPPVAGAAGAARPTATRPGAPPKPAAKPPAQESQEKTDEEPAAPPAAVVDVPPGLPPTISAPPPVAAEAPPDVAPVVVPDLPPVPAVAPADAPPSVVAATEPAPPLAPTPTRTPSAHAAPVRKPPAPIKRGITATPSKPKPKPTLVTAAAAAAAKAQSRAGSERPSVPRASLPPTQPTQSTEFEFSQTQKPEATPTQSTWAPPTVASSLPPTIASSSLPPAVSSQDSFLPPTVAPASSPPPSTFNDELPAVAAPLSPAPPSPVPEAPDAASLAAAAVASITEDSRAKRRAARAALETTDEAEGSTAPAKRPRRGAGKAKARKAAADENDGEEAEANGGPSAADPRARGAAYASRGRAGTAGDRRLAANRNKPQLSHPELDGVQADDMVGIEVNPTVMTMKDLATTLVSQGRVSARTIKLHEFQRGEEERKRKERVEKADATWKRRQIVRRKARQIKNAKRQLRRADARKRGQNPDDVVSDDSVDSDEDYDVEPDRLTPPGSPVAAERVAPLRLDPMEVDEAENGTAGAAEPAPYDPDDDPEGLGFRNTNSKDDDLEELEEMGEVLEDFQLPVEDDDDAPDFSGLQYAETTGGYLDENGEWVDTNMDDYATQIVNRKAQDRRNILEGTGAFGREVEIIDTDTQFVNAATWGKKVANDRWTVEETELFFSVLRETGENYSLMKAYFPGRTMRQLKNKGLRENRENPTRMNDAIFNRKPIDKEYLTKSSGYNAELPFDREKAFFEEVAQEKERVMALGPPDVVPPEGADGILGPEQRPWVNPVEDLEFGSG